MAEFEEKTVEIVIAQETFQKTIDELTAEGWQVDNTKPPIATYHLVRQKPIPGQAANAMGPQMKLTTDDSKIVILRASGKVEPI